MKIAIFTDTFYPCIDGVVISILNSTRLLAEKGHKIKIFAPSYRNNKIKLHKNITVERHFSIPILTYKDFKLVTPNGIALLRKVKQFDPDVIHIGTYSTLGVMGSLIAKRYRKPLIGTFNTLASEFTTYMSVKRVLKLDKLFGSTRHNRKASNKKLSKRIVWNLLMKLYNKCDIVIVPSPSIKKELKKHGLKKPMNIISYGVNTKEFTPKKEYSGKTPKLLHVGRISHEKNIDVIIKSLSRVKETFPNIKLSLVGDGPAMHSLRSLIRKLRLKDNVKFYGKIPHKKLGKIYRDHDIFLTASTMETFGLVVMEAMACGLPVIGVNKYAIPDLVLHGKNGFISKPFDDKEIAGYIEKLVKNKKLRERLGKNSLKIAKTHDLKYVNSFLEKLYKKSINIHKK
jgi:glycosyltransferase involved in cell wall biosynthesis